MIRRIILTAALLAVPHLAQAQTFKKICDLGSGAPVAASDYFEVSKNCAGSRKESVADLSTYLFSNIPGSNAQILFNSNGTLTSGNAATIQSLLGLASVAASGAYGDLTGKPTIDTLLPSQPGHAGQVLTTNGAASSWAAVTAAGSAGDIQFNSGGTLGGRSLTAVLDTLGSSTGYVLYRSSSAWLAGTPAAAGLQAPITLTTTGTGGAATLAGSTLNIPQYASSTAPGSNKALIYNDGGAFAASSAVQMTSAGYLSVTGTATGTTFSQFSDVISQGGIGAFVTTNPSGTSTAVKFAIYGENNFNSANIITGTGHFGGIIGRADNLGSTTALLGIGAEGRCDASGTGGFTICAAVTATFGDTPTGSYGIPLAFYAPDHPGIIGWSFYSPWAKGTMQNAGPVIFSSTLSVTGAVTFTSVQSSKIGSTIASASTIPPAAQVTHVSGTATIQTITPPAGMNSTTGGCLTLIADGAWATTTSGGNIGNAITATANYAYLACYDGSKWYFSH